MTSTYGLPFRAAVLKRPLSPSQGSAAMPSAAVPLEHRLSVSTVSKARRADVLSARVVRAVI